MTDSNPQPPRPWYREPWPWLLMAAPAAAIVGGALTLWLAVATADGLVADDYYRRGLAINQVLHREQAAARMSVALRLEPGADGLTARLEGRAARPEALYLQLAHATRAGNDMRLRLAHQGDGIYRSELPARPPGHWRVIAEDPRREWRVTGDWSGAAQPFVLGEARPEGSGGLSQNDRERP
jgi:hypothetical protein